MKLFYKKIICMLCSFLFLFLYSGLCLFYIAQSDETSKNIDSVNQAGENKKEFDF